MKKLFDFSRDRDGKVEAFSLCLPFADIVVNLADSYSIVVFLGKARL